jgi:hypothetical protein
MAAIDEHIHLDCVYFLIRRQPDVLQNLLSSTPTPPAKVAVEPNNGNNGDGDRDEEGGDDGDRTNVFVSSTMHSTSKKRKREYDLPVTS